MKEIVDLLHERRQIEIAKSILENAGYKVSKIRVNESDSDIPLKQMKKTKDELEDRYRLALRSDSRRERIFKYKEDIIKDLFSGYKGKSSVIFRGWNAGHETGLEGDDKDSLLSDLQTYLKSQGWSLESNSNDDLVFKKENVAILRFHYNEYYAKVTTNYYNCEVLNDHVLDYITPEEKELQSLEREYKKAEAEYDKSKKSAMRGRKSWSPEQVISYMLDNSDYSLARSAKEGGNDEDIVAENEIICNLLSSTPEDIYTFTEDELFEDGFSASKISKFIKSMRVIEDSKVGRTKYLLVETPSIGDIVFVSSEGTFYVAGVK